MPVSAAKPVLVFVYGTLRSGHGNNRVMFENGGHARLLGRAITNQKFYLSGYRVPRASSHLGPASKDDKPKMMGKVVGEVWEVNKQALDNMDRLEGHPRFYTRSKVPCFIDGQKKAVAAWIYLISSGVSLYPLIEPVDGKVEWPG